MGYHRGQTVASDVLAWMTTRATLLDAGPEGWQDQAACTGMGNDLFFPERGDPNADTAAAKAVCAGCPVRQECADYALTNRLTFGIWGGLSERERRRLRSTHHRARAAA